MMNGWIMQPSLAGMGYVDLVRVDGVEGRRVGTITDPDVAARIVVLLNRHGLEDTSLTELEQD